MLLAVAPKFASIEQCAQGPAADDDWTTHCVEQVGFGPDGDFKTLNQVNLLLVSRADKLECHVQGHPGRGFETVNSYVDLASVRLPDKPVPTWLCLTLIIDSFAVFLIN